MADGKVGRPKGIPKTGGRKKGTLNHSTAEIKALAQQYGPSAIRKLAKIMTSDKSAESSVVACARELLDRGYGKASEKMELSGPDGGKIPVTVDVHDRLSSVLDRLANRTS